MNPTVCTHKNNPNFWIFGLFFFLYFFIMATCFPFLPIWLSDVIGLNKTETGLVFSSLSLFAICFQPILGVISGRRGKEPGRVCLQPPGEAAGDPYRFGLSSGRPPGPVIHL